MSSKLYKRTLGLQSSSGMVTRFPDLTNNEKLISDGYKRMYSNIRFSNFQKIMRTHKYFRIQNYLIFEFRIRIRIFSNVKNEFCRIIFIIF